MVLRGCVLLLLLLHYELEQPETHGEALLRVILLCLRLLHPSVELLMADCQRLVIE